MLATTTRLTFHFLGHQQQAQQGCTQTHPLGVSSAIVDDYHLIAKRFKLPSFYDDDPLGWVS